MVESTNLLGIVIGTVFFFFVAESALFRSLVTRNGNI